MKTADRICLLMARKRMTNAELAKRLGVSRQAVQFWCVGRSLPKGTNMIRLAEFFGVSPEWLRTGEVGGTPTLPVSAPPLLDDGESMPLGYSIVKSFRLDFRADPAGARKSHGRTRTILSAPLFEMTSSGKTTPAQTVAVKSA